MMGVFGLSGAALLALGILMKLDPISIREPVYTMIFIILGSGLLGFVYGARSDAQ